MTRPKFDVKHFLVCRAAPWEGSPGPRTLEGVCHRLGVPPGVEFPFEFDGLWSYLRVFNVNAGEGVVPLYLGLVWTDAPKGPRRLWTRPYAPVTFRANRGVVETAVSLGQVAFPDAGWYEFRLMRDARLKWAHRRIILAREQLLIER